MGGFLQTLLFGVFGLRLHAGHMTLTPRLIPALGMSRLVVRGVHYRRVRFTVDVNQSHTDFTLLPPAAHILTVTTAAGHDLRLTNAGEHVIVSNDQSLTLSSSYVL